ncbi:hypothetical protein [Plasmodium yoelii yoelii]|uniref:Uncharacterized protein n=1 Tax=Plasmodium yoelii yoelii TaxID=73239 RepID=Q7RGD1_PLAYO|nr:hypothetical protein [Plasmodium yoelii yoelii]
MMNMVPFNKKVLLEKL